MTAFETAIEKISADNKEAKEVLNHINTMLHPNKTYTLKQYKQIDALVTKLYLASFK